MSTCRIFDLKRFSVNDGPGIRTSVFFKGCPLSCWWCHNPESQSKKDELFYFEERCAGCGLCAEVCPKKAIALSQSRPVTDRHLCDACGNCSKVCPSRAREIAGREITVEELLKEIERDEPFFLESYGGVTFTGGEPLSQPEILLESLKACKELNIHTAVDTSGYAKSDTIRSIAKWTDLFLYDLKLASSDLHEAMTGVPNELILANLKLLKELGANIRVRVPVVPGVSDSNENAKKLATTIADLKIPGEVELLPFHWSASSKYERLGKTLSPEWRAEKTTTINILAKTFTDLDLQVTIRE